MIPQELLFALEAERDRRQPQLQERVLLHPRHDKSIVTETSLRPA